MLIKRIFKNQNLNSFFYTNFTRNKSASYFAFTLKNKSKKPINTKRDPEWEHALPIEEIPGPSILKFLHLFLPTGALYKKDQYEMFKLFRKRYGNIVSLPSIFGRIPTIFIFDPADFEKVFRTEGVWPLRLGLDSIKYHRKIVRKEIFKDHGGLLTEQGYKWHQFRSVVNPVMMQPKIVKSYTSKIDNIACVFIDRIRDIRDTETLEMPANFQDEIRRWSLESIGVISMDTRLGLLTDINNPKPKRAFEASKTFLDLLYEFDFKPSIWRYIRTPKFQRYINALNTLTDLAKENLEEAKQRLEEKRLIDPNGADESVIEKLLKIDPHVANVMAMDVLLAGADATTSALSFCLYQMAKNPVQQSKLREDIMKILPNKDSPLTAENMNKMPYLRACIKEALRVYPVVLSSSRAAGQDIVLSGYQIPKNTHIVSGLVFSQHNEKYFPRAFEFIPERWLRDEQPGAEAVKPRNPFVYFPFGFGPRMCIGKRFADLEIEILLSRIIRNFKVEWNYPNLRMRINSINTPGDPLKFKLIDIN